MVPWIVAAIVDIASQNIEPAAGCQKSRELAPRTLNHARMGSPRDPKVLLPQDGYGRINTSFDGPPHVISETNILHTLTGKKVKETLQK